MIRQLTYFLIIACAVTSNVAPVAFTQNKVDARVRQANNRATFAKAALERLLQNKDIPMEVLKQARAIAVFPSVTKIRGGLTTYQTKGQGLISRRTEIGWTAPAFFEITKAGSGIKEVTKLVILFTGDGDVNRLRLIFGGAIEDILETLKKMKPIGDTLALAAIGYYFSNN